MPQTSHAMMIHRRQGIGLYMVVRPRMGDQPTAPDRLLVDPVRLDH